MKHDARRVYALGAFWQGLAYSTIFTLNMVYQVKMVGLNPLQLVLVGTTLEASAFIFEIPTGIVADVYSRRLSTIIGVFLIGFGFILEGSFPLFGVVLLAQVLWGLGYTFTSGAHSAWIADEVGAENVAPVYVRATQLGQIGSFVGIPLAVALGSIAVNIPVIIGGMMLVLFGVYLVLFMPEEGFEPTPKEERNTWQEMKTTLRDGVGLVKIRPALLVFLGGSLIFGLFSEGYDRLWTPFLLENFTFPFAEKIDIVVWFGILSAVGGLISLATTEYARRRIEPSDTAGTARTLQIIYSMMVVSLFSFAMAPRLELALAAFWVFGALRTTSYPIYDAWINQFIDSKVRATVLSMSSQSDALGQIVGGPIVGAIGTLRSIRAALVTSSLILIPVVPLYQRLRKVEKIEVSEED